MTAVAIATERIELIEAVYGEKDLFTRWVVFSGE